MTRSPRYPTQLRGTLSGGRLLGIDGSMWLLRAVPQQPGADAKTPADRIASAVPLLTALDELAVMARSVMGRRAMSKGTYRDIQVLSINLPRGWVPDPRHDLNADYLAHMFGRETDVIERVTVLAVRLVDQVGGGGGLKATISSVLESTMTGGIPVSDFDRDAARVGAALERSGLREVTQRELAVCESWWSAGTSSATPFIARPDAVHVCTSVDQARALKRAVESGVRDLSTVADSRVVTIASCRGLELDWTSPQSPKALWVTELFAIGALAVSVRGRVEPGRITTGEIERNKSRIMKDLAEISGPGKEMVGIEQSKSAAELDALLNMYASNDAPHSLVDVQVTVALNGLYPASELEDLSMRLTAQLVPMEWAQLEGILEMQLGSAVRANPYLQEMPVHTVAMSGVASLSTAGDTRGAVLGFTERDRQVSRMDALAAADEDSLPFCVAAGQSGSGKSVMGLWLADQWARAGTPGVFIDPKPESDHSQTVEAAGGQVASLDDIVRGDGMLDPIRNSKNPADGITSAAGLIMTVNPFGKNLANFEADLLHGLRHGVARGATCTGQALEIAAADGLVSAEMMDGLRKVGRDPMFRSFYGTNPHGQSLALFDGLTLIKVGGAPLELPNDRTPVSSQPMTARIGAAVVRAMLLSSMAAMRGRDGVVLLDEAWVFLGTDVAEIDRVGRLARSWRVFVMMLTQKVSDAVNAGLSGSISRGIILPMLDPGEARAACKLFRLEPTAERIARITGQATMGGADGSKQPNWNSMRALHEPGTRNVLRGTIGIYSDLAGRAVPVEVALPPAFLARASTNKIDMIARDQALERARTSSPAPAVGDGAAILDASGFQAPDVGPAPVGLWTQEPAAVQPQAVSVPQPAAVHLPPAPLPAPVQAPVPVPAASPELDW